MYHCPLPSAHNYSAARHIQCSAVHSAQHQVVRHHTESTDGAARHAGCSGLLRPCVTAHRRRRSNAGQVRVCTGPAMQQHINTQRAHNTHSPARLPLPLGRHPGHCLRVTAPSAQHNTTQHNTTQHNTTQHNTTQHNRTQHNTTQHNTTQHNTTQHNTTQHNSVFSSNFTATRHATPSHAMLIDTLHCTLAAQGSLGSDPDPDPPLNLLGRVGDRWALLERRGEGGRGSRGEPLPPAERQHIRKKLQKCTKLTRSACTFVIMSEDRQCT